MASLDEVPLQDVRVSIELGPRDAQGHQTYAIAGVVGSVRCV